MESSADTVDSAAPLLGNAATPPSGELTPSGTSSNSRSKAGASVPPFNKWVPFAPGYWRFHLGTDMLMASWLFVLASAMWVGVLSDTIATENVKSFPVAFNHDCTLACAVLFLLGSVYFVYLSYPEEMEHQMADLSKLVDDPSKINDMSFVERYFTGSDMLVATWFFAISTLPFLVYGVYAVAIEPANYIGYVYVVGSLFTFAGLGMWLVAALPENMAANGGTGSTIFYDRVFSQQWCCCGCFAPVMLKWAHTDMLAGMWFFFLLSASAFPLLVAYVAWYPTLLVSWLDFIMGVAFIAGAGLMVHASYPQNFNSTMAFDTLTCSRSPKEKGAA